MLRVSRQNPQFCFNNSWFPINLSLYCWFAWDVVHLTDNIFINGECAPLGHSSLSDSLFRGEEKVEHLEAGNDPLFWSGMHILEIRQKDNAKLRFDTKHLFGSREPFPKEKPFGLPGWFHFWCAKWGDQQEWRTSSCHGCDFSSNAQTSQH